MDIADFISTGGKYLKDLSSFAQLGASLYNSYNAKQMNKSSLDLAKKSFSAQYFQNQQNADRQENLQREEWQREDNSYQRTVDDMRAAGINPLSMQGVTGSSFSGLSSQTASLQQPSQESEALDLSFIPQYLSLNLQDKDQKHRHTIEDQGAQDAHKAALDAHNESIAQQQLIEAQEREALASAADQEYETKWKIDHNTSGTSHSVVSGVKEVGSDVINSIKKVASDPQKVLETVDGAINNVSEKAKSAINDHREKSAQSMYDKSYDQLTKYQKARVNLAVFLPGGN